MSWLQLGWGNCINAVCAILFIHVRTSSKANPGQISGVFECPQQLPPPPAAQAVCLGHKNTISGFRLNPAAPPRSPLNHVLKGHIHTLSEHLQGW